MRCLARWGPHGYIGVTKELYRGYVGIYGDVEEWKREGTLLHFLQSRVGGMMLYESYYENFRDPRDSFNFRKDFFVGSFSKHFFFRRACSNMTSHFGVLQDC